MNKSEYLARRRAIVIKHNNAVEQARTDYSRRVWDANEEFQHSMRELRAAYEGEDEEE